MDATPPQPPARPDEAAPPRLPWFRVLDAFPQFRLLLAEMRVVVTELDDAGRITYVAGAVEKVTGYDPTELIGMRGLELIHPEDLERARTYNPRNDEDATAHRVYRARHRDEHWMQTETLWETSFETSNGSKRRSFVTRDVTQLKATQDALRETEERYRTVVESADDLVTETDSTGSMVFTSPNLQQVLGYEPSEIRGRDALSLVHPDDVDRVQRRIEQANASQLPTRFDNYRIRHADGRWLWFLSTGISYQHRSGELRILNIGRDISAVVRREQERQEFEARIEQAQRLESFGSMAGGIAHDFNNLLTPLLSDTALAIASLSADDPALRRLERVRQAAQKAAELTNQMLSYAGNEYFESKSLDLSKIAGHARGVLSAAAGGPESVTFELAPALPRILGDQQSLLQAALNLVNNAAEATEPHSREIVVRTGTAHPPDELALDFPNDIPTSKCVFLEVEDNGSGMDQETRGRIFDPFFTTRFTGRGLGLASLLGIVRAHSAAVEVESAPGRGTRFRILIPTQEERAVHLQPHLEERTHTEQIRGTVLLIEDDFGTSEVIEDILTRDGFRVLCEEDGKSGIRSIEQRGDEIRLVILDFKLPDGPSPVVFERIREARPQLQVLLLSGHTERTATAPFAGKNLSGFLHKPFLPDQLLEAVHRLLSEPDDATTVNPS